LRPVAISTFAAIVNPSLSASNRQKILTPVLHLKIFNSSFALCWMYMLPRPFFRWFSWHPRFYLTMTSNLRFFFFKKTYTSLLL